MTDVVKGTRASKLNGDAEASEAGHGAGRQWAADRALASELRNLEAFQHSCGTDWGRVLDPDLAESAYSPSELVYFGMHASENDDCDGEVAVAFWDSVVGEHNPARNDPAWLYGFVAGALELWDEIEGQP